MLIVEDNPHIIEMYSYVLKKLATAELRGKVPLEVHFAADGHAALQALAEGRFNLVLTDLYMPVMDGFALVEKMRADRQLRDIPVVAIAAVGARREARARAKVWTCTSASRCVRRGPGDGEAPASDQLESRPSSHTPGYRMTTATRAISTATRSAARRSSSSRTCGRTRSRAAPTSWPT